MHVLYKFTYTVSMFNTFSSEISVFWDPDFKNSLWYQKFLPNFIYQRTDTEIAWLCDVA